MWQMIAAVVKLVTLLVSEKLKRDRDSERSARKKVIRKDLTAAIKARDPSEITRVFDRMKRE